MRGYRICLFLLFVLSAIPDVQAGEGVSQDGYGNRFDPDLDAEAMGYDELAAKLGPLPTPHRKWKIGAVVKFLGNRYWQSVAEGMSMKARELGLMIDVSAGAAELDHTGQLAVLEAMVAKDYDALLISPQTDRGLVSAVEKARRKGILVVNVADAVWDDAQYYVGPNHYEAGAQAARSFGEKAPQGGKVAVITGPPGVYSARKSTEGFTGGLPAPLFEIVAQANCDWDLQTALVTAASLLKEHPDLKGFYCNSDVMALGVAQAVKMAGKSREVAIIGNDGIDLADSAIYGGDMAGTVNTFPNETGQAAVEVALRILGKQRVPRVVRTPQEFISHTTALVPPG